MASIGSELKKIRESRNISFDAFQAATKLPGKIIKAIEEDKTDTISPVYLRGFLKIYCKQLGLNPDEFVASIEKPKIQEMPLSSVQKENPPKPKKEFKKPVAKEKEEKRIINFNPKWVQLIIAFPLIIIFALVLFTMPRHAPAPKTPSKPVVVKKQVKKTKPKKEVVKNTEPKKQPKSEKNTEPKNLSGVSIPAKELLSLTVSAKQNSYLRIKADGKPVFLGTLKKGDTETRTAKEKLEITVSNAGGLEFQLNGRVLPSFGSRGQAIKRILITKDGIEIDK